MSGLFHDDLKNMQTDDFEQETLVYLYPMNHAKTQPKPVILAANTFIKDSEDPNPLIWHSSSEQWAVCAEKITDCLCDPLLHALKDENPYVRKMAAVSPNSSDLLRGFKAAFESISISLEIT